MSSAREMQPEDVATGAPEGPAAGQRDRKDFTAKAPREARGGTDVGQAAAQYHEVPVTAKGAAVLQSMEAREMGGGGGGGGGGGSEALGSKADPTAASLAAKVQSALGPGGVGTFVTHNVEEYANVKAAEEVAATPGLYETQGEARQRRQEELADYVEVWPRKEDVAQLESMVESAPGGEVDGVRLEKGGDIAKLHSAADKGTSCVVSSKVARLLTEATLARPKETKDKAAQRLAQAAAATEGHMATAAHVMSGSPPTVFVPDAQGAARIDVEELQKEAQAEGGGAGAEGASARRTGTGEGSPAPFVAATEQKERQVGVEPEAESRAT